MRFTPHTRFAFADDGTVASCAGTQTNCGGIAAIRARIWRTDAPELLFAAAADPNWAGDPECASDVPGAVVPIIFRAAVFEAAAAAFAELGIGAGYGFELVEAFVHPVDGKESRFREAGRRAVLGWFERPM